MDRVYQANAIETPPSTTASSGSYPTAGNKALGQLATVPGPYWFYSITEEIRNALIAAGVTPDAAKVNQLAEAMGKFLPLSGGTMTGELKLTDGLAIVGTTNNSSHTFMGGTAFANGAYIQVYGKDSTASSGAFNVVAQNGSTYVVLNGKPDGTLTWGGKKVVCVQSWSNGTSWYRKYSDGWIEQGGEVTHNNSQVAKTVTFALQFSNTNYTVVAQTINKTAVAYGDGGTFIFSKTTTSFQTTQVGYGANDVKANWYACGY